MYAVIDTGGKQARVEVGEQLEVELLSVAEGDEVSFVPKLVVDGETILSGPEPLRACSVTGRVVGLSKGPKVVGFTYRAKARGRRRFGHRQHYSTVEITGIDFPGRRSAPAEPAEAGDEPGAAPED